MMVQTVTPRTANSNPFLGKSGSKLAAMHAERILKLMEEDFHLGRFADVEPDNISYTSVLTAWANSARKGQKRAVEKAESI